MQINNGGGGRETLVHKTDLALALLILAISAGLWYATTKFAEVPAVLQQGVLPTTFPRLVIGVIVVLALLLPFEHLVHARRGSDIDEDRSTRIRPISIVTALLLVGLGAAMVPLGTIATMFLASAIIPVLWGERRLGLVAVYAVLFPLVVTLLFVFGLQVNFLPGIVGYVFR